MIRIIPSFSEDESFNQLSVQAEVFFRRLWNEADDYGRFSSNPLMLKSRLFPLKESIRATDIPRWLAECEKAGLIACYEVDSAKCVQILGHWNQKLARSKAKYPPPSDSLIVTCISNDNQLINNCGLDIEEDKDKEKEENRGGKPPGFDFFDLLPEEFHTDSFRRAWKGWLDYRRERKLARWVEATLKRKAKQFTAWGAQATIEYIEYSIGEGYASVYPKKAQGAAEKVPDISSVKWGYRWRNNLYDYLRDESDEDRKILNSEDIHEFRRRVGDEETDFIIAELKKPFSGMAKFVKTRKG